MIKKIHYIWLGSEEPEWVTAQVAQWRAICPDFEIIKWDEKNTDISEYPWGKKALKEKRWGFVSDIIRLQVLKEHGGWYFDTDVQLYNHPEMIKCRDTDFILGYIGYCVLGTAVQYSSPGHPVVAGLLDMCKHLPVDSYQTNNGIYTQYFLDNIPRFILTGKEWKSDIIHVFPKEMFEVGAFSHKDHMTHHMCTQLWKIKKNENFLFKQKIVNYINKKWKCRIIKMKILSYLRDRKSPFWIRYRKDSRK